MIDLFAESDDFSRRMCGIHYKGRKVLTLFAGEETVFGSSFLEDLFDRNSIIYEDIEFLSTNDLIKYANDCELLIFYFVSYEDAAINWIRRHLPIFNETGCCVVGICCDCCYEGELIKGERNSYHSEEYEIENRPAELVFADITDAINTMIFIQVFAQHTQIPGYQLANATMTLLSMWASEDKKSDIPTGIERLSQGGTAYYHHTYNGPGENVDITVTKAMLETFIACPFYMSNNMFCKISYSKNVTLFETEKAKEEAFLYLLDYLPKSDVYIQFDNMREDDAVVFEFLFLGIDLNLKREHNRQNQLEWALRQRKRLGKSFYEHV